ncbi:MAG TPA: hypothetical protein VKH40_03810 [Alloacidobacterium sp.]|nr:hypothetical protein [Alloacidobacterium sp.]
MKFKTYDLKTRKWTDFAPGMLVDAVNSMPSPDGKYLYYTIAGTEPRVVRLRFADHQIETITSLKDFNRMNDTNIGVAPDGSPIFTRATGSQEIYALNVRWP